MALCRSALYNALGLHDGDQPVEQVDVPGAEGDFEVHLGVEKDFSPARKAHPAFLVEDLAAIAARLRAEKFPVIEDDLLPGYDRFFTADPFGNRIELLQPKAD